ncbi:MAG: hypothetical protein GC185_07485 [Alphaproteobacteria bacterium]|nr:hypothetical protein [Alphaproteobacteria bacterium]
MQDDFNHSAPKSPADAHPWPKLREAMRVKRENIAMLEAARNKDWPALRAHIDAGADPAYEDDAAMQCLIDDLSPETVTLLREIKHPAFPRLDQYALVLCAAKGETALVEDILKDAPAKDMIAQAAFAALRNGHDEAADKLLPLLEPKEYDDRLLIGLLLHRPDAYDAALAARPYPANLMLHFINACAVKDEAAMNHALDKMIDRKKNAPSGAPSPGNGFIGGMDMMDLDGYFPSDEAFSLLCQSGHIAVLDKFLDNFSQFFAMPHLLLHTAAVTGDAEGKVFLHLVEKLKMEEDKLAFIANFAAMQEKRPLLLAIAKAYPAIARQNPEAMLTSAISTGEEQEFFDALDEGHALPDSAADKMRLLERALTKDLPAVADHLIANMDITPQVLADMRSNFSLPVMKKSAQLSGNWRFEDDKIFWRALQDGDAEILSQFENVTDIHAGRPYAVSSAVEKIVARGDDALLGHVLRHTAWNATEEAKEAALRAHRACLSSPGAAQKAAVLIEAADVVPRALDKDDLRAMAGPRFAETLAVLEKQGFTLPADTLDEGLAQALAGESAPMMQALLEKGARLPEEEKDEADFARKMEYRANADILAVLEKWTVREQRRPAPGIEAEIKAAATVDILFGGPDCTALRAAYAGKFAAVIARADGGFDVQKLAQTKDAAGNNILDILGAQGRLDDLLKPALWKNRDAAAFIQGNTPPCYHGQCDFNGLNAALRQIKLQERGAKRFELKRGPRP